MRLLKLAVEKQRWDLAAHTIVLATARIINKGDKFDASKTKRKNGSAKKQQQSP